MLRIIGEMSGLLHRAGLLLLARAATLAATFGIFLLAARFLTPGEVGAYALAMTCAYVVIAASELGFTDLAIIEVSKDRSKVGRYAVHAALAKIFVAVVSTGFLSLIFYARPAYRGTWAPIALACLGGILRSFIEFSDGIQIGLGKVKRVCWLVCLQEGTLFGGSLWMLARGGGGVYELCGIYAGASLLGAGLRVEALLRLIWPFPRSLEIRYCQWILYRGFKLAVGSFLDASIFGFVNVFLIAGLLGEESLARFQAAYKLIAIVPIAITMLTRALISETTAGWENSALRSVFTKAVVHSLKLGITVSLPFCVGIVLFAETLIQGLFGADYASSAFFLQLLVLMVPLTIANQLVGIILTVFDRQSIRNRILAVVLVLHTALSGILITWFGAAGAIVAMTFSACLLVGWYLRECKPFLCTWRTSGAMVIPLGLALVLVGITQITRAFPWTIGLYTLGVGGYFFALNRFQGNLFFFEGRERNQGDHSRSAVSP